MGRVSLTTVDRQTFCIYCQQDFKRPSDLAWHILKKHPGTYAAHHVVRRVTR
jgi:hypothetical protein